MITNLEIIRWVRS